MHQCVHTHTHKPCTCTHTNHVHAHTQTMYMHTNHVYTHTHKPCVYTHTHTEIFCLKAVAPQQSILWGDSHLPGQLEDLRSNRSGAGLFSGLGKLSNPLPLTLVCLLGLASTQAGSSHPRTMLPEREEWVAPTDLLSYCPQNMLESASLVPVTVISSGNRAFEDGQLEVTLDLGRGLIQWLGSSQKQMWTQTEKQTGERA